MKSLYGTIATAVMLFSLTVPALQARAEDEVRSAAWQLGYGDGVKCVADSAKCKFDNPYVDTSGGKLTDAERNTLALNNSDYIVGFIIGKAEANSGK